MNDCNRDRRITAGVGPMVGGTGDGGASTHQNSRRRLPASFTIKSGEESDRIVQLQFVVPDSIA